jgi:polyisoprenoid-binding protein YceI
MSSPTSPAQPTASLAGGTWRLDPARSSVEFHVRHFYGLMTVKGHFDDYQGTLNLQTDPAIELTVEAGSLDTKQKKRDKHLRSEDFFHVAEHPQVRFASETATVEGDQLTATGQLHAAGRNIPVQVTGTIRPVDDEFEIEASALADQRELGMTWSPIGITRSPSTLRVSGRLVREAAA